MDPHRLIPGDATLIENIVSYLKAKGIFDEFRHECLADVDTKSSFQNLNQRVDGYASKFLATEIWNPDLNKNELRNKLRRHIDESGMLAVGADHVVEQVINPKIHSFFLPKIIEVVHQYVREQTEQLHKKADILNENSASDSIAPKARSAISDPIADILSFTHSKAKLPAISNAAQQKHVELKKKKEEDLFVKKREDELVVEKKKKEDEPAVERKKKDDEPVEKKKKDDESLFEKKNILETVEVAAKNLITSGAIEEKSQPCDKEIKKEKVEELDPSEEAPKKVITEDIKSEDKKVDNVKMHSIEIATEESKISLLTAAKSSISSKKDFDKSKQKLKPIDSSKVSGVSKEAKKPKKESLEKHQKQKSSKASKEPSSPVKNVSLSKTMSKEEKLGQISKSKSSDSSSSKTSDSSHKKPKFNSSKKDNSDSRHKKHSEKSEKLKVSQTSNSIKDLSHQLSSADKGSKAVQYSSSQDSSQGSDQERSSKKEKQKHFIKHSRKDCSEKQHLGSESKSICEKKLSDENYAKKQQHKMGKISKSDKPKDMTTLGEVSKISSRSNSFGSTSSVGSSSNINSVSNSDDACENSNKDKKKRKTKEPCHPSNTLPPPPPPPPPPPSTSLACELTSSAEMSSMDETQSSTDSEELNSVESSENSSSDSEVDANISVPDMLEKYERNSTNSENEFYDIFLYSSSSSEFEGYGSSSEKISPAATDVNMDVSVSSVHTSELSSYDDELSDDGFTFSGETESSTRRLTLKKAQQLLRDRAALRLNNSKNANVPEISQDKLTDLSINSSEQKSSLFSSEDEFASEPKRSLRRERKLNPRYASSEYTSIFNSKKETFITKQASPIKHMQSPNSSPIVETKLKKKRLTKNLADDENSLSPRARSVSENDPARKVETHDIKQELEDSEIQKILQNAEIRRISVDEKNLKKPKIKKCLEDLEVHKILVKTETKEESVNRPGKTEVSDDCKVHPEITIENSNVKMRHSKEAKIEKEKKYENEALLMSVNDAKYQDDSLPLSEEMDTTIDEEQLFKENNKTVSFADHLKVQLKLKAQNSSQFNMNSHSVKRKLKVSEAPPAKRPCSRSSVDSSSSEPAANENKPFNSEMQNSLDDKLFRVHELNVSDLPDTVKSELFCKQRTNNNGDILILNSHGKTSEKKTKESSSSKELSAL